MNFIPASWTAPVQISEGPWSTHTERRLLVTLLSSLTWRLSVFAQEELYRESPRIKHVIHCLQKIIILTSNPS